MLTKSIGFVGGGRVARILLGGWRHAGVKLGDVVISDPDDSAINRLQASSAGIDIHRGDILTAARQAVVFLAVHPPAIADVLGGIASGLRDDAIVLSLAPKFTIAKLSAMLDGFSRLIRVIPNAASIVGCGFNPIAWGEYLPESDRSEIRDLLQPLGQCPEVSENTLEAYAIVTAMGPTYFWPQWSELLTIAESFGLSHQDTTNGLRGMLEGAMATLFDSGMTCDEVFDLVPVKPLGELEPTLRDAYRTKLIAVMEKIRP